MNANIMKGERSKLLAAVAVLVMMVCVFAVAIPNSDAAEYGSIDLPEEYGTLTSASSGTVDLSVDEYTAYVIEGDVSYTGTVDFTPSEGETIYIKSGSLVFDNGQSGGSMDLAGTICILDGAKLSVGSSTMSIKDTFQVRAEAGSTFVVESGSFDVNENFIGNDENAIVKLTEGVANIYDLNVGAFDILLNNPGFSVDLDGVAELNKSAIAYTPLGGGESTTMEIFNKNSVLSIGEGSVITVTGSDVQISGDVTNDGEVIVNGGLNCIGDMVNNGDVTINGTATVSGTVTNNGIVTIAKAATVTKTGDGSIVNTDGASFIVNGLYIEATDGGETSATVNSWESLQAAIDESVTQITIDGEVAIPAGETLTLADTTLTVSEGSKLIVSKGANTDGSDDAKIEGTGTIVNDGTVSNLGTIADTIALSGNEVNLYNISSNDKYYNGSNQTPSAAFQYNRLWTGVTVHGTYLYVDDDPLATTEELETLDTNYEMNAGDYRTCVYLSYEYNGTVYTNEKLDFIWKIIPATPDVAVEITGWNYGAYDESCGPTVTYNGGAVPEDVTVTYTYTDSEGTSFVDPVITELVSGEYTLVVTTSSNGNYGVGESDPVSFTIGKTAMDVTILDVPGDLNLGGGTYIGDLVGDNYSVTLEDETITYSGIVKYIPDISEALFGDDMDSGFYSVIGISNNNDFEITLVISEKEIKIEPGQQMPVVVYLGTNLLQHQTTYTITPSNDSYAEIEWDVVYDLDAEPLSGFSADADKAMADMNAAGIVKTDVAPNTMWMTWYQNGVVGDVYGELVFDGETIYKERVSSEDGYRGWYFSFDAGQPSHSLSGDDQVAMQFDAPKAGVYTLNIVSGEDVLETVEITVPGTAGYGFSMDAQGAVDGMTGVGYPVDPADVSDETMWIVWYNADAVTTDVTATVTLGGEEIYTQTIEAWKTAGVHGWYFCFGDNPGSIGADITYGTYEIEVTDAEGNVLAEGTVYIAEAVAGGYDETGENVEADIEAAGGSVNPSDVIAPKTMWMVWYGGNYEGDVTATLKFAGETVYTEAGPEAWKTAGYHSWYFSFDAGQQVANQNPDFVFQYGDYELEISVDGQVVAEMIVSAVDPNSYSVTIDEDGTAYDIVGVTFTNNEKFYLPGTAYSDKTLAYWELVVDGQVINTYKENALIIFGKITDSEGNPVESHDLVFRAVYGTSAGSEIVTDYNVDVTIVDESNVSIVTTPVSGNMADSGMHTYRIVVQSVTFDQYGIPVTETVFEYTVLSAIDGSTVTETRNVALPGAIADGYVVNVYFETSAGSVTAFLGSYADVYSAPEKVVEPVADYYETSADAADAIDAIFQDNGRNDFDKTDVGEQTMFVTFDLADDLVGVDLQATALFTPADGSEQVAVNEEVLNFDDAGIHCWYFSFDPENGSWIGHEIGVGEYKLSIATGDGTSVVELTVTVTE